MPRSAFHVLRAAGLRSIAILLLLAALLPGSLQRFATASPWWLELSRYVPYPVYLAPAVALIVVSAGLGRLWRAAGVAALGFVLVVTMDLRLPLASEPSIPGGHPLRLMTYNIKAYKAAERSGGFEALAREIALRDPDVLVMQDTQTLSHWTGFAPGRPVFGLPNVFLVHGYVVASRAPLRACEDRALPAVHMSFVACTVTVDGRDASLVTVHFDSPRRGLVAARREGLDGADDWERNYADRLAQSQALAAALQAMPRPLVVAGDLNAPDASPVVRTLLDRGLRDAFATAGSGWGFSYGDATSAGFAFLRIDHVLASPDIGIVDASVGHAGPSEHRPVIADLVLPP